MRVKDPSTTSTGQSAMTPLVKPLLEAGFTEEDATHAILAICRYALGCALDEQQPIEGESMIDHDEDPFGSPAEGTYRIHTGSHGRPGPAGVKPSLSRRGFAGDRDYDRSARPSG
jgi:hypothetical protein